MALPEVTAIIGTSLYKSFLPETHDLGARGPALTYSVPTKPRGHVLTGSDGTATARVQLDAWAYSAGTAKILIEAIANGIDGIPGVWGNGTCVIMSVVQQDETDSDEPPIAGTDQPTFHTMAEYSVKYRVTIPSLT